MSNSAVESSDYESKHTKCTGMYQNEEFRKPKDIDGSASAGNADPPVKKQHASETEDIKRAETYLADAPNRKRTFEHASSSSATHQQFFSCQSPSSSTSTSRSSFDKGGTHTDRGLRGRGGGLSALVGSLNTGQKRAKKQSVLDKSAQDWCQFVQDEQIEEELSGHMLSKNSYLDKQEFLLRADYSQFERERGLRAQERKTQQPQGKK